MFSGVVSGRLVRARFGRLFRLRIARTWVGTRLSVGAELRVGTELSVGAVLEEGPKLKLGAELDDGGVSPEGVGANVSPGSLILLTQ